MSDPTPTTPASPPAAPIPVLLRATALVAAVGVVVALLGAGLLLRPVETSSQDCGTVAAFLLQGRTDEPIDPGQPHGTDDHERCSHRVAEAARPGAVLVVAGVAAALLALIVEVVVRAVARHRRHRAQRHHPPVAEPAG